MDYVCPDFDEHCTLAKQGKYLSRCCRRDAIESVALLPEMLSSCERIYTHM